MSLTWGTDQKQVIESGDDTPFVREAIKEAADASGLDPETAKFSDFGTHTQRYILRKAQELKQEYHIQTERI